MKPYFIIFILLLLKGSLMGQGTSSATAFANIVTSVGAERLSNNDFGTAYTENTQGTIAVGIDGIRTSTAGVKLSPNENGTFTFINIIGSSFVYDVTVQNNPLTLEPKTGVGKIKVNLFKMTAVSSNINTDNTSYPIGASFTADALQTAGYRSYLPFTVTVNFN